MIPLTDFERRGIVRKPQRLPRKVLGHQYYGRNSDSMVLPFVSEFQLIFYINVNVSLRRLRFFNIFQFFFKIDGSNNLGRCQYNEKKQMGNNYVSILIFRETKIGKFDSFL